MPLLMPNGTPAKSIDRIMLMVIWVKYLDEDKNRPPIIAAGMGKPTFAINSEAVKAALSYWTDVLSKNRKVQALIEADENITDDTLNSIAETKAAIDYDSPQGNLVARKLLAKASTDWYETKITEKDVLLTVGDAAGIFACFQVLKNKFPESYIATPVPYYSLYEKAQNKLHFIDVMRNEGYQFTAEILKESLATAKKLNRSICAILICDPNNPLSTVISPTEWERIAIVLRSYPKILIILDEAYAEMQLNGQKYVSLITVAPDLKKRTILFRSATKGLSAAGERMAATFIFDHDIMQEMIDTTVNIYGHAPVSSQIVYATAFSSLTPEVLTIIARYHKKQVDYVYQTLASMGAGMPSNQYKPMGTFYVLCNDNIMLTPCSYFGMSGKSGYFRITCSEGLAKLKMLMQRLAMRLTITREILQGKLLANLVTKVESLREKRSAIAIELLIEAEKLINKNEIKDIFLNAKQAQEINQSLKLLLQKAEQHLYLLTHHASLLGDGLEKKAEIYYNIKNGLNIFSVYSTKKFSEIGIDFPALPLLNQKFEQSFLYFL